MNEAENVEVIKNTDSVKCKSCGSNMTFDPETQKLKCSYCGYTEDFSKSADVEEISIENALKNNERWNSETLVYNCENCGARVVVNRGETAGICPFCSTPHVVAEEDLEGIKPNAVVPFKFGKEKIFEIFRKWVKRKIFAPKAFKKQVEADKIKGVFMPYFTFDSNTDSVYEGRVGDEHTRTVRDSKGNTHTETYVVWRKVRGTFNHFFDDILINAGSHMEKKKANMLAPFDWSSACVYENKFLSGYVAHHYDRDIQTCWSDAKKAIDAKIREMIIASCHCDRVDYMNITTRHSDVTYKYVMLPVYVISYSYKKKNYVIYANGSTGKLIGKTPVSPVKATIAAVLGTGIVGLIVWLIYMFLTN